MAESATNDHHHDAGPLEVIKQLIIAFVLAMTFRGFVIEGFVIPTGSMAPTLMGRHVELHSDQTGFTWDAGLDFDASGNVRLRTRQLIDPMLRRPIGDLSNRTATRMGDRILVLKCLYPFYMPQRFDVVVFKNPNDPNGDAGNYIKRLIGLPNETVWLVDGDVFVQRDGEDTFRVQRKPEHVQRTLWQPVYYSDAIPINADRLTPPWRPLWTGVHWQTENTRTYRTETAEPTELMWASAFRPIDDWAPYNMLTESPSYYKQPVNDVRVAAAITPEGTGLTTAFELLSRDHVFQFAISEDRATVRYRRAESDDDGWIGEDSAMISALEPGKVTSVEFWHVDQQMRLFVDGAEVTSLSYEWSPEQRLRFATGMDREDDVSRLVQLSANPPQLRWKFEGSPVSMRRVRVDRDIHYTRPRYGQNDARDDEPYPGFEHLTIPMTPGFGTSPDKLGVLRAHHYMMLGDNTTNSLDSRLWGNPNPVVAAQIDPAPFVVHRDLLIGKAWLVYFPSPLPLGDGRRTFIPNFGDLRFIR